MKKALLPFFVLYAFTYIGNLYAEPYTVVSPKFVRTKYERIAVLPFDKSTGGVDATVADKLTLRLMEMGFTVIERAQLEKVMAELKLNYTGILSPDELKQVGKILTVDLVVFGTEEMKHMPSEATTYQAREAYNIIGSESVRFVDVESGEVVIASHCCDESIGKKSYVNEIANSIADHLQIQPSGPQ